MGSIGWILFIVAVVLIAGGVAYATNRVRPASHPPVTVADLDLPAGLVVFTSSDCEDCTELMAALRGSDVAIREVTYELEPDLFVKARVSGVPLTLVVDDDGVVRRQVPGLPRKRTLDRLRRAAG